MPDITKAEKTKRELLVGKSWEFLNDNFHKFNEDNKIKIALELCKKNMPTILEGDTLGDRQTFVYMTQLVKQEIQSDQAQRASSQLPTI